MKKYLFTIILLAAFIDAKAQTETTSFNVDSLKVIFKPTKKNIVTFRMYFRAGVSSYPASQAGIGSLAFSATAQCGTKKYTANEFKDIVDKYSLIISGSATEDYGYMQVNCLDKYFGQAWDLFTEALMHPVFDESEVALLKNKLITRAKGYESSPDARMQELMMQNGFGDTPYATDPDGTEETLSKLTATDLKNYYNSVLNSRQMFMVVVGNVSKEDLVAKIHASFSSLPVKPYTPVNYQFTPFTDYKLLAEKRELATNYISAIMNSPKFSSPDYVPFRLGMSEFSGGLFHRLRVMLHLSYAPGARVAEQQMPYAEMYVSTTQPKQSVQEMSSLLKRYKSITINDQALTQMKSGFITNNYLKQESSSAIAASLGKAEILGGWQLEENLTTAVNNVTGEDINRAFNKYIVGLRWCYLGNLQLADDAADAFKQPVN